MSSLFPKPVLPSQTQCCCRAGPGPSLPPDPRNSLRGSRPPGCNPSQQPPSSASRSRKQTAGSSALYKVTRRLLLSRAEPGIPAWLWAHRICQRPSISTQPHATPPVSVPGHCLPHFPRPPDWNFSHLLLYTPLIKLPFPSCATQTSAGIPRCVQLLGGSLLRHL